MLLFSFSSDRPEQAGIPLPTRSGLLFAFFRIASIDKDKRAKSTERTGCPTCVLLLIDAKIRK